MIELDRVCIDFPGFSVRDVSLSIATGEFFALIGPTGAGKSVLVEAIAGLSPVASGRIRMDGRDITHTPPESRGLGIVYQDHALFPHLSVRDNIAFGPRLHRLPIPEIRRRLERLADALDLGAILDRRIRGLSGGECQRVALARALIVQPSVLILDEPLSSLDPRFRYEVHALLKRLHEEEGITFIIVSHDFEEVLFLAQRVALIRQGRVEQTGPCETVFHRPATAFAASFVGMGNVFAARFDAEGARFDGVSLPVVPPNGGCGHVAIRPEDIVVTPHGVSVRDAARLDGTVEGVVRRGAYLEVRVRAGTTAFIAHVPTRGTHAKPPGEGAAVDLHLPIDAIHVF